MPTDSAHDRWWQVSEVVFGIPLVAAIVLQWIKPLSFPIGRFRLIAIVAGALLMGAGLVLVVLTRREFARQGEHTDPGHPTHHIMSTGVFSFSRNPMYLGIVVFLAGAALAVDWPWVLVMLVPSIAACHYILIAPEERYLAAKFGDEYAQYARSVQRWMGRK